jgi:hypothetical protein
VADVLIVPSQRDLNSYATWKPMLRGVAGRASSPYFFPTYDGVWFRQPQEKALRSLKGEFVVQVFDQGEPGSSREEITGDSFSIELIGRAYNGYTRGGYIEGGNVQVES